METRQCRFCLGSKVGTNNPLISPCQCKGSLEFVHFKCLNRWRRIDIDRNGRICSLCMTAYLMPRLHEFEVLPRIDSFPLYFLNYPGLILSFYHYTFVIAINSTKPYTNRIALEFFYIVSQYLLTFTYAMFFVNNWRVVNRPLYMSQLKTAWTPLVLLVHFFLFLSLEENPMITGPILSFYLGVYWKSHIRFLQNTNNRLLELELEQ